MVICKFYAQGYCKFGDRCRFEHSRNDQGGYRGNQSYGARQQLNFSNQNNAGFGGPNKTVGFANQTPTVQEILNTITQEIEIWDTSNMWPLSCFGYQKYIKSFPGLDDMSMEEVRLKAYDAQKSGKTEEYKQWLTHHIGDANSKKQELKRPNAATKPKLISLIENLSKTSGGAAGTPVTSKAAGTGAGGNLFGKSAYGGGSQKGGFGSAGTAPQPAAFGGGAGTGGGAFGGGTAGKSVFGGGGGQSVFGGAASTGQSAFGGANQPGPSAFGGAQPATQSVFGGSAFGGGGGGAGGGAAPGGSVFGSNAAVSAQPQSAGGGMFGNTAQVAGQPAGGGAGGSVFGSNAAAVGGQAGFGGAPPAAAPSAFGGAGLVKPSAFGGGGGGGGSVFGGTTTINAAAPMGGNAQAPAGGTGAFGGFAQAQQTTQQVPQQTTQPGQGLFGKPAAGGGSFGDGAPFTIGTTPGQAATQPTSQPSGATGIFAKPLSAAGQPIAQPQQLGLPPQQPALPTAPTAATGAPPTAAASQQRSPLYSELDQLTAEERAQFEAPAFTAGKIPTRPPPRELCS